MRRIGLGVAAGLLLTLTVASTAFAAHCFPVSKPDGAGQKLIVLVNPATGSATFIGTNAAGRVTGGFADVYLDLDGSGTLTDADLQVEDDVFVIANHSGKLNPAQGGPAVLPSVQNGDPAGPGKGVDG
ncbi:MAG TPA: hypothetical protein VGQ64_05810 [Candidatus Limnocylindrales bacterium]|jgi:hypothetical protein|nr:hypothetical protein [Candidatus Limnocylindrales bacterium]